MEMQPHMIERHLWNDPVQIADADGALDWTWISKQAYSYFLFSKFFPREFKERGREKRRSFVWPDPLFISPTHRFL